MTAPGRDAPQRQDEVYRQLQRVIDPELGIDIVRLGLVYDILAQEGDVTVVMTLTTQGCPMQSALTGGVERTVRELPWVTSVTVDLVWVPPWNPSMIR